MQEKSTSRVKRGLRQPLAVAAMLTVSATLQLTGMPVHAATYKVLHDFYSNPSGAAPDGGLVSATDGTMYGATSTGGVNGTGTLFSVSPSGVYTTLYNFKNTGDPATVNQGLALSMDGNLYGVSVHGGVYDNGTLFRFNIAAKTLTILQSFKDPFFKPLAAPVVNKGGVVFGSFVPSIASSTGFIYRWTAADGYSVVQNFPAALCDGKDGVIYGQGNGELFRMISTGAIAKLRATTPQEGTGYTLALALAPDKTLWGVSSYGGANNTGIIYSIAKNGQNFSIIHTNTLADPVAIKGPVAVGNDNRLYATGYHSTAATSTRVFSIGADGVVNTIVDGPSGEQYSGPVLGTDGQIYYEASYLLTTPAGGVFKATLPGYITALRELETTEPGSPTSPPVKMANGNYYGITTSGGAFGYGGIYRVTPASNFLDLFNLQAQIPGSPRVPTNSLTLGADGNAYSLENLQLCTLAQNESVHSLLVRPTDVGKAISDHPLTLGPDGKLYSVGGGSVYTVGTDSTASPVNFNNTPGFEKLVTASDGNLYAALAIDFRGNLAGYSISPTGVLTPLDYTAFDEWNSPVSAFTAVPGALYGAVADYGNGSSIYRIDLGTQTLSRVFTFQKGLGWQPTTYTIAGTRTAANDIAVKADGTIFGAAAEVKANGFTGRRCIYKITPAGDFSIVTLLLNWRHSPDDNNCAIKFDTDGSLLCVASGGPHGDGTLFRVSGI